MFGSTILSVSVTVTLVGTAILAPQVSVILG